MRVVLSLFAATPEQSLYEYGVLGIGIVALSYLAYKMFNILLKDRDKAINDRDAMVQDLFTKVLPAITRNTDVLESRQDLDRDLIDAFKESNKQLVANAKVFDEVSYILRHGGNHHGGESHATPK
jgi:hypothetical protein